MEELIKYFNTNSYQKVIDSGLKKIRDNSENPDLYRIVCNSYLALKKADSAIDLYKTGLEKIKNSKELYFDLGNIYLELNKNSDAIKEYFNAINLDENYINALNNIGLAYIKKSEFKKAKKYFKKIISLDPANYNAICNLGISYLNDGNPEKAEEFFSKAYGINSLNINSFIYYPKSLINQGKYSEARKIYIEGINNYPDSKSLKLGLSSLEKELGNLYTSEKIYEEYFGKIEINKTIFEENYITEKNSYKANYFNFIGSFELKNKEICNKIIDFFESRKDLQKAGLVGNRFDHKKKKSIDISIHPNDLDKKNYEIFKEIINELQIIYANYIKNYNFLYKFKHLSISTFNIQKYESGGHFSKVHAEREQPSNRVFAWMIYLNDIPKGGETYFPHFDKKVIPKKNKVLIWPAEWTHAHSGLKVDGNSKYILTGWIDFST